MQLSQFKQFGDRISRDSSLLNVIASDSREGREMSSRLATATSVRGKYEALMVEAVARVKRGEPAFFYAWSPSWVNNALIPGEDVVWLPTPREALPPNVPSRGSALVPGVKGCAGGADPCRMAMASWNWAAVGNRQFIAANPAVRAFVEQMKFPLSTWSAWEYTINKSGGSTALLTKLSDEWLGSNRPTFDQWVASAKMAAKTAR